MPLELSGKAKCDANHARPRFLPGRRSKSTFRMKSWAANAVAFLVGLLVVAIAWTIFAESKSDPPLASQMAAGAGNSSGVPSALPDEKSVPPNIELARLDEQQRALVFLPNPGESPKEEFQRLFREMLHGPVEERDDRLALLLARLQSHGRDAIPVIREYLRSGRDVPRAELYDKQSPLRRLGNLGSFRDLLFSTLSGIVAGDPALVVETTKGVLGDARTLKEALAILAIAEKTDLEAVREETIAAITRLASEKKGFEFAKAVSLMTKLKSQELVPVIAAVIEAKPYSLDIESFLGALWSFPEATRVEYSRRLVASEEVRKVMRRSPSSWIWLDARDASFRAAIVEDFKGPTMEEMRMYLVRGLGNYETKDFFDRMGRMSIGDVTPAAGAPGSKEQAAARIALLDELEPFCDTPLLKQHQTQSRAALVTFLKKP